MFRRFFSPDSYWNTPLDLNPKIALDSTAWIKLLAREKEPNLWVSTTGYTIPVYAVHAATPRHLVKPRPRKEVPGSHPIARRLQELNKPDCFAANFENPVPIPSDATNDVMPDSHLALVDYAQGKAWDMLGARKLPDGSWEATTGITYSIEGPGVFGQKEFPLQDGESVHIWGPGRAAGVPIIAGLIMREEILAGSIDHKLAFACWWGAERRHVYPPATWTDGFTAGGPPQGAVIQLDPDLDLNPFNLSPAGKTVATALQKYGAVNVDTAAGTVVYAEGLYEGRGGPTWQGLFDSAALRGIDLCHYRWIKPVNVYAGGLDRPVPWQR